MGPRWKGKVSEAKAFADPMSKIVLQLQSSLIQSKAHGLLLDCSVLLAVDVELVELFNRACFGQPIVSAEKDKQLLQLSLEEAFYLCYDLKCLSISGAGNQTKKHDELWQYMKSKNPTFPELYKAYSHLRQKNWVVRSGISQYGVHFVAYRHHPALVHSEYAVLVASEEVNDLNSQLTVWSGLHATVRLCGSVAKALLVLDISRNGHDVTSPLCLEHFIVEERTIRRWDPESSREERSSHENGIK